MKISDLTILEFEQLMFSIFDKQKQREYYTSAGREVPINYQGLGQNSQQGLSIFYQQKPEK